MAAQSLGNSKNKRFAQQMANRPAAAQNVTYIKKRNIQQRLGSNVKTRLGGVQQRGRGFRGGRGGFIQRGGFVQRGGSQQRGRGRGVLVYSRGGRGALRTPRANNIRGRGGYRGGRGANRGTSGFNYSYGGQQRGYRGSSYRGNGGTRGAARGTRGRGRGRGAQRPQASREDLDTQLDAYMSGSNKTFIDADLGDL